MRISLARSQATSALYLHDGRFHVLADGNKYDLSGTSVTGADYWITDDPTIPMRQKVVDGPDSVWLNNGQIEGVKDLHECCEDLLQ